VRSFTDKSLHPHPAIANRLIPLKEAAEAKGCADTTLRNNAKARRLPAYQRGHGAPVYVFQEEVDEFLRGRPDIRSVVHPDTESNASSSCSRGQAPALPPRVVAQPLSCLNGASPETIELVSRCLVEIAETLRKMQVRDDEPQPVVP